MSGESRSVGIEREEGAARMGERRGDGANVGLKP